MALYFSSLQKKIAAIRSDVETFLWQQDISKRSFLSRLYIRSCQIVFAVIRDLIQGQLSLRAMSLVFTTMIGFFPLLALTFAVLKSLGVHNAMEPTLLAVLEPLGDRSAEITAQILSYVDDINVGVIGITSVGLLLYIVLDMMRKIEISFNYIWDVRRGRSWSNRISEYLFAVIVSPLLLFLSISITSYVNTNFFERFLENITYGGFLIGFTAWLAPLLLMSVAFAFAYGFIPNTKVRFSSAFVGGFVTTIIWKLMGSVFQQFFVTAARESIYLAFATAIVVLFFVYIGWLVALIGSSIAFYHQNPSKTRNGRERQRLSISQQEEITLALASTIIRRFHNGESALGEAELANSISSNPPAIGRALHALEEIGLIAKTADDPVRYLPAKSINDCKVVDIWRALRLWNEEKLSAPEETEVLTRIRNFQTAMDTVVAAELGDRKFIDAD